MNKRKDLTGQRFGRLVVLDYSHSDRHGQTYWRCVCDCGNETVVQRSHLISGGTTSCGCKKPGPALEDLTGQRFGRLTVLSYDHSDRLCHSYWRCLCDCGNETTARADLLQGRNTISCGCYHREIKTTHGMSNSRLYNIWSKMKDRCDNPNIKLYKYYGERGVFICDEWLNFENFRDWALSNSYEDGLSIDRINNNDGYYPENCRWVDAITQSNNRRSNHNVSWHDETHTIAEWARIFGISYSLLWQRIRRNDMQDFEEYFKGVDLGA